MKKKTDTLRFAVKCILFPAIAFWIIVLLNKPYQKIDASKYQDTLKFTTLEVEYDKVDLGNLGSSHGAYDFDYTALQDRGYSCFNFANTSQSYNYDYAILKEYGDYMTPGSVMLIPVSYFSFNNEVINDTEAEAMSSRYYHFLSPKNIPDYDLYFDIVTNRLPILSAGEDILKLFPSLQLSLIVYAAEEEPEINVEEFAARAADRYSRHFDNKENYFLPERIEDLYHIIEYCQEHEITPVLLTTPFSKYYRDLVSKDFLKEFNITIETIVSDTGVSYYDYSYDPRFRGNLSYFSDSDHLNGDGAVYFTQILVEEVPELQRFQ